MKPAYIKGVIDLFQELEKLNEEILAIENFAIELVNDPMEIKLCLSAVNHAKREAEEAKDIMDEDGFLKPQLKDSAHPQGGVAVVKGGGNPMEAIFNSVHKHIQKQKHYTTQFYLAINESDTLHIAALLLLDKKARRQQLLDRISKLKKLNA